MLRSFKCVQFFLYTSKSTPGKYPKSLFSLSLPLCTTMQIHHFKPSTVWINRVKVANPARGQLNRNEYSLSPFTPDDLVSRDRFDRPAPRQPAHLHTQAESGAYSRDFTRFPRRRPFIYIVDRHRLSHKLSGHAIAYRWRSLPRGPRCRASSPQGNSSNRWCLFKYHRGPIFMYLSYPTKSVSVDDAALGRVIKGKCGG